MNSNIPKPNPLLNTQLNYSDDRRDWGLWHDHEAEKNRQVSTAAWVSTVLDAVADAIAVDDEEVPVYTSGATNIFKYPELADSSKASELISAFEDKGTG